MHRRRATGEAERRTETTDGVATETGPKESPVTTLRHVAAEVATKANSLFGHMLSEEAAVSAAMARRRAMMLVDVLVERHGEGGRLKRRWVLAAAIATFCYLRYALPALASWGSRHFERSVNSNEFAETVGGPSSRVSFAVLVVVTLGYISMLHCSSRLMEARLPVKRIIFETLVVYNLTQMLLNAYVCVQLLREAVAHFPYPWGNKFNYTTDSHRLGYYIWFHYHLCQLELLDTVFVVIRKKFQKITFLHVWLRLLNMWAWYFACRYACGGDTYFPAATNAATRAVVFAFYSLSLFTETGVPLFRKARVTGVQMLQFGVCALHALFCLAKFWDMHLPKILLIVYFLVMMNGLMLYTDFHYQVEGKSEAITDRERKVSIAFDSSGWLYCYHFGVGTWLREHIIPEGMTPEDSTSDRFPSNLTFSGSSGGALVAAALSMGMPPSEVFESVLSKHPECKYNPFRMLPAVEHVVRSSLPANAYLSLSGRFRVLLTRLSWKFPFFTAEVVNKFKNNEDVFHGLRASCHVPVIGGLGPYRYDGHAYFDGMFWPQMLVPWKGTANDCVVRVSAMIAGPSTDIKPPLLPMWWSVFPPEEDILRGIYWMGYKNAAQWFSEAPSSFECLSCRSSAVTARIDGSRRNSPTTGSRPREDSEDGSTITWLAARQTLLKAPGAAYLPDVDPVTGRKPSEYVDLLEAVIAHHRRLLLKVGCAVIALTTLWLLIGWL